MFGNNNNNHHLNSLQDFQYLRSSAASPWKKSFSPGKRLSQYPPQLGKRMIEDEIDHDGLTHDSYSTSSVGGLDTPLIKPILVSGEGIPTSSSIEFVKDFDEYKSEQPLHMRTPGIRGKSAFKAVRSKADYMGKRGPLYNFLTIDNTEEEARRKRAALNIPIRAPRNVLQENRRRRVVLESPHLMYSVMSQGKLKLSNHRMFDVLRERINREDIWTTLGVNRVIEMHVDWQSGLLDALPDLFLPTYQNTPVTVTVPHAKEQFAYLNGKELIVRLELCEIHDGNALVPVKGQEKDQIIRFKSSNLFSQEVYFSGVKRNFVGDKTQRYIIRCSLLHQGELLDVCLSRPCYVTSSRRFYKKKENSVFSSEHLQFSEDGSKLGLWTSKITPGSIGMFNTEFIWKPGHPNVLFSQDSVLMKVRLRTESAAMVCIEILNEHDVSIDSPQRRVHLARGRRSWKSRHLFLASKLGSPVDGLWKCSFDLRIHRQREAEGRCKLRVHWFDENMNLLESFDYGPAIMVETSAESMLNKQFAYPVREGIADAHHKEDRDSDDEDDDEESSSPGAEGYPTQFYPKINPQMNPRYSTVQSNMFSPPK